MSGMIAALKNPIGREIISRSVAQLCNAGPSVQSIGLKRSLPWVRSISSGQLVSGVQAQPQDLRSADLKGRDLITFDSLTPKEIKTLLWIALDLKASKDALEQQHLCNGKSVFCVYEDPMTKLAVTNAARRIGAVPISVPDVDITPNLDLEFFGRSISSSADMILVESRKWSEQDIEKLSVGSIVPVINLRSTLFAPGVALAECLSLQEHYEFLRRLTVSYIGPSTNPLLNTYATVFPKLGIHFRFLANGNMNEAAWQRGIKLAQQFNTELHQCDTVPDAIFRTHTISTCFNGVDELLLTMKDIKEADLNWTLLHHEIHKNSSVSDDMLRSKQSLVWTTIENLSWIIQACVVGGTQSYEPKIRRPVFEGIP